MDLCRWASQEQWLSIGEEFGYQLKQKIDHKTSTTKLIKLSRVKWLMMFTFANHLFASSKCRRRCQPKSLGRGPHLKAR